MSIMCMLGYEEAVVGKATRGDREFLVYDEDKILLILQRDMSREDAREYFDFNIKCAWVGEGTPAYVTRWEPEDKVEAA